MILRVSRRDPYYTEGKGFGTSYQELEEYSLSTTGNTYIDGDKGNSALEGDPFLHNTGEAPVREGFEFDPNAALVEGFFPEFRDEAFDEDPIPDAEGNLRGGNVPIFNQLKGGELPWDADYYEDRDNTSDGFDKEYIKNLYPDSAGTATGLYTGVKTYVGAIAVDIYEETVETLAEKALDLGKSTGVVSSVPFNHATPAAAVAHVNQRNKYNELSFDQREGDDDGDSSDEVDEYGHPILDSDNIFYQIVNDVKPTVVLGGGHYLSGDGTEEEPNERYITFEETENLRNGVYDYTFVERGPDASKVLAETAAEIDPEAGDRLFGIYGARGQGGNLPWRTANDDYSRAGIGVSVNEETGLVELVEFDEISDGTETNEEFIAREVNENPNLKELTAASLDVLEDDKDGFWLMVEGGDIDWSAHANDMDAHLGTLKDFDESVAEVQDWIENNGGYEENLLIVTADHDHYLTLTDEFPELLAEALLTGEGGSELTTEDVASTGHFWGSDENVKNDWATHTTRPVPVYYQGDGSELIAAYEGGSYQAYGETVEGVANFIDQVHLGLAQAVAISDEERSGEEIFGSEDGDIIGINGSDNQVFAGAGDDLIDLTGSQGGNTVYGAGDNDTFILGSGDTVFGVDGDDRFFVTDGGGNTITGNLGADQFWIADGGLPEEANIITDFTSEEDVFGINLGIGYDDLSFAQSERGAEISYDGNVLAIVINAPDSFIAQEKHFVFT